MFSYYEEKGRLLKQKQFNEHQTEEHISQVWVSMSTIHRNTNSGGSFNVNVFSLFRHNVMCHCFSMLGSVRTILLLKPISFKTFHLSCHHLLYLNKRSLNTEQGSMPTGPIEQTLSMAVCGHFWRIDKSVVVGCILWRPNTPVSS